MGKYPKGFLWFGIGFLLSAIAASSGHDISFQSERIEGNVRSGLNDGSDLFQSEESADSEMGGSEKEFGEFSASDNSSQEKELKGEQNKTSLSTPLSITIRGGSSLGAYEAGYLYVLTEAIKRNPKYFTPDVLSGASAGTINAILSVVSLGTPLQDDPLRSVYYRIWTQLNFRELIDVSNSQTPPGALSSRQLLWRISDELRSEWLNGFNEGFSAVVGISTTRLIPENIVTPGGLDIPNQQAKFVFRVEGRGSGKAPVLKNFPWVKPGMEQLLLPFGKDAETDFDVVMQATFASCGIPIVFPPQPIDYCVTKMQKNSPLRCGEEEMYTDSFVDGGVVDNSPIRLAYRVHNALKDYHGPLPVASEQTSESASPVSPNDSIFLYLDPEHLRYPSNTGKVSTETWRNVGDHRTYDHGMNLFRTLPKFLRGFVNSSRSSEIYSLLNSDPQVNIQRTVNSFAPISAQISGQFGFMEREILKYDFYLGMHDAENYLRTDVLEYLKRRVDPNMSQTDLKLPQDSDDAANMKSWKPYRCMRAMFDSEGDSKAACDFEFKSNDPANPPDVKNFKILMQVSINRVYSHCTLLENTEKNREALKREDGMCLRAFGAGEDGVPPRVPGVKKLENGQWHQCIAKKKVRFKKESRRAKYTCHYHRKNENDYQYVTRLMGAYGYYFRDLGLSRNGAKGIREAIQNELFSVIDTYAEKYRTLKVKDNGKDSEIDDEAYAIGEVSGGDRALILTLGKPAITFLNYSPPRHILSVLLGKASSVSWSRSPAGWFRFNWNLLQIGGISTMNDRVRLLTFTHAVGLEWQPPWLSSAVLQSTLIGRVGYQFSFQFKPEVHGHFSDDTCGTHMQESPDRCSLPLIQTLVSLSILSRIRLEIGVDWFPPWAKLDWGLPNRKLKTTFNAAIGFQFLY